VRRVARLPWLGPGIVVVGVGVAALGIWYWHHAQPVVGAQVDTISVDARSEFVVYAEAGDGDRNFVELHVGDELKWQALVPHYEGRVGAPGLAWNHNVVSVRVNREGQEELFVLSIENASKVGGVRLAIEHEPIPLQTAASSTMVTLSDHIRTYELVAGVDWHQLVAVDLSSGTGLWKLELGKSAITGAQLVGNSLIIDQGEKRTIVSTADGSVK
jgi:hypothetical protein